MRFDKQSIRTEHSSNYTEEQAGILRELPVSQYQFFQQKFPHTLA